MTPHELGRIIWEARIKAAWTPESAKLRFAANPWPSHPAADHAAEHDLAIASAKAVLAAVTVTKRCDPPASQALETLTCPGCGDKSWPKTWGKLCPNCSGAT